MNRIDVSPEQFLSCFFEGKDTVCLRIFSDRKDENNAFKGLKLECEAGQIATLIGTLKKHNAENRGIFFVVNSGGHNDAEITRINAQFTEMDEGSFEEQEAKIGAFALPPSLIVKTRKSLHCYWLMKKAEINKFRHIQKQLVAQFRGDPACINESRVLRLPGFFHCKQDPVMVEVVKFSPELRYTQEQLSAALPSVPDESASAQSTIRSVKSTRKGLTQVGKRCDFIQFCKDNAAALPENLWYAMITNLAVFEDGDRTIHALSKPYPKYSFDECQKKIAHFLDSGTKPMTCAKISECGYKCAKFEQRLCDCKSPAALCYKPLTADELMIILNSFEIPDAAVDKIKIIKEFVQDYLYNVESVIAETIINHEVKPRFGLKAGDVTPLIRFHREIYKKYCDSKETRRETEGAGLPDWYEPTDRGGLRFLPCVLADHMANNVAAFYGAGTHYFYDHGVYEAREDLAAFAAVRSFMLRTAKSVDINDAEKQWRSAIRKQVREINANPYIINVKNGLLNVLDGSFREHTTEYFSTVQINANYCPTATCPQFLQFLSSILPESEIPLIQEIFGYLLIPVNKAQKSFVFVGAANAGKSTLLSIAQDVLLGSDNVSNIPWQSLGERFNKAELFGKLANIFADLPSKNIDDGGMFKSLTGEDSISAERKNKDPFNYRPYARLLFSCNDIPKNYADRSDGFYRRLIIIRFDKAVPQNKRDPNLRERVATEADGIFMWALLGLVRLMRNNYIFTETPRTTGEVTRYKTECNSALTFIAECCAVSPDASCPRAELYTRYKDYCSQNGYKAQSNAVFNKELESGFPEVGRGQDKVSGRKYWRGIAYVGAEE